MVCETWLSPAEWLLPPSIQTLPLAQVLSRRLSDVRLAPLSLRDLRCIHHNSHRQNKMDAFNRGTLILACTAKVLQRQTVSFLPPPPSSATCCCLARNVTDNHNRCHSHYHDFRSIRGVVLALWMFLIIYRLGHPQTFILSFQLFMTLSANAALIDGTISWVHICCVS